MISLSSKFCSLTVILVHLAASTCSKAANGCRVKLWSVYCGRWDTKHDAARVTSFDNAASPRSLESPTYSSDSRPVILSSVDCQGRHETTDGGVGWGRRGV